jgi:hypothetical protein
MSSKRAVAAMLVVTGLVLAQASGTPTNLGVPSVPGTATPESSPATRISPPAGSSATISPSATMSNAPASPGPAASFGAAPPPTLSPR